MKRRCDMRFSLVFAVLVMLASSFAQEEGFSPTFELTGELAASATIELADLQALPSQELEATYTSRGEPRTHLHRGAALRPPERSRARVR